MSKKVVTWGAPKIASAKKTPGSYSNYQEFLAKANAIRQEQEEATSYLQKAMPGMLAILEYKMRHKEPLMVMRPLQYQTSEIPGTDSDDDGFYAVKKGNQSENVKFKDVYKTIMPGTMLMFKSLDGALNEFVFVDGTGREHSISFEARNQILTQTDIFETVKKYFESKGE